MVSYHNDCLSYITKVDNQPKGIKPFEFIKKCPLCGKPIEITVNDKGETTLAQCVNDNCIGRLKGKIENYFKAMSIKGIKMNTIDELYDNKIISDIPSLYSIDYKKVSKLLGPKIAQNIQKAIEEKEYYDYEILGSLSINGFNLESAKLLCKKYSLDEIIDFYNENKLKKKMLEIEGFAEISTNYFIEGLKNNESTVEFLYSRGFKVYKDNFKDINNEINICVTGWRPDPMLDIKLTANGFKVKSSVSKKVNILVYSGEPGATKTNKAKELGIEMMSKEEFLKKYNLN
jgi:DNA ligase (NAD+)